jgi:MOSC domain-containing protein YiiM
MEINGTVIRVLSGQDANSLLSTPLSEVQVTLEGFAGDLHAGFTRPSDSRTPRYPRGAPIGNRRQVSIVSQEELAEIAAELDVPEIRPEWLGANLMLGGIPYLTHLPPATQLYFAGGVTLWVSGENRPCRGPGELVQAEYPEMPDLTARFVKAARHKRGLVAMVEMGGVLRRGEAVEAKVPELLGYYLPKD